MLTMFRFFLGEYNSPHFISEVEHLGENKMKKQLFTVISILGLISFMSVATAKPMVCPFTDIFQNHAPPGSKILGTTITNTGYIKAVQEGGINFDIVSTNCNVAPGDGTVTLVIGADTSNACKVTIHDGPYEADPSVTSVSCKGDYQYTGMSHQTLSYLYSLNFSTRS